MILRRMSEGAVKWAFLLLLREELTSINHPHLISLFIIHPSNLIHPIFHSSIILSISSIVISIAYQHWTSCCKYLERRNYTLALATYPLHPSATVCRLLPRSISESFSDTEAMLPTFYAHWHQFFHFINKWCISLSLYCIIMSEYIMFIIPDLIKHPIHYLQNTSPPRSIKEAPTIGDKITCG